MLNKVTNKFKTLYNKRALFSTLACGYQKKFLNDQSAVIFREISFASRNLENKALF
jgi:hypothetical protein